ncbi:phosphodiesterase [Desulfovibrio ferrophilus]|uniref:3',5'-cyclic adenosine monophosphate phosphodiesterase CpdA n=1 Tax=Desulfovibrio ferrophilus TaxID=241368 RepID=A0A2Z6AXV0_9BACT|nr:phosphodiesterase [Desulfovibrio ferrophilus]BBD08069.1 3',5'-cyclic adenosine monophosphate phosphodiesterase CpdA [Desulfovibrio ferrophilus]
MLIAQISDFHISASGVAYGQADTNAALKRAVAHLNALVPAPDAVIITGDVADAGNPDAYAMAARILSDLDAPFWMVPGNHDQRDNLREAFPDHDYLSGQCAEARACFVEDRFPLRLLGLDTLLPGAHSGGVDKRTLVWLESALSDGKPTVVFMHHPPFPVGIGNMDAEPFRLADELEGVIRRFPNVLRVCCGHMHRPVLRGFGGTLACIAPSVSMQLVLDLTQQAPSQFVMEPGGLALHLYEPLGGRPPELVTHFGLIPGGGHEFAGPYPFKDVVSPV